MEIRICGEKSLKLIMEEPTHLRVRACVPRPPFLREMKIRGYEMEEVSVLDQNASPIAFASSRFSFFCLLWEDVDRCQPVSDAIVNLWDARETVLLCAMHATISSTRMCFCAPCPQMGQRAYVVHRERYLFSFSRCSCCCGCLRLCRKSSAASLLSLQLPWLAQATSSEIEKPYLPLLPFREQLEMNIHVMDWWEHLWSGEVCKKWCEFILILVLASWDKLAHCDLLEPLHSCVYILLVAHLDLLNLTNKNSTCTSRVLLIAWEKKETGLASFIQHAFLLSLNLGTLRAKIPNGGSES